jgi:hypothetical protein
MPQAGRQHRPRQRHECCAPRAAREGMAMKWEYQILTGEDALPQADLDRLG